MSNAIADQLAPIAGALSPTLHPPKEKDAFFSPMEYIVDRMSEPALKAKLAGTAAWSLDNQIVQTGIGLYFQIRKDHPTLGKDIEALTQAFHDTYNYESFWGEGHAATLVKLLYLQEPWHADAYRLNTANGYMNFRMKSIDEIILTAEAREPAVDVRARLRQGADFYAKVALGDLPKDASKEVRAAYDKKVAELAEENYQQQVARELELSQDRVDMQKSVLPIINTFIREAYVHMRSSNPRYATEPGVCDIGFHEIEPMTRLVMCRTIASTIPNALRQLAKVRTCEYGMALAEAHAARGILNRVCEKLAEEVATTRG